MSASFSNEQKADSSAVGNGKTVLDNVSAENCENSRDRVDVLVANSFQEINLPPSSGEVRILENFLNSDQCSHLIANFAHKCELSKVVNPQKGQSAESQLKWRTSTSALMYPSDGDPVVLAVTEKVAAHCRLPPSHVEVLQLVRYEKGQQYTPHRDYFEPDFKGQNRIFTILIYLNDLGPDDGGRTIFPELGIAVVPKLGTAVFWRNCLDDGTLIPSSLHTGEILNTDGKIKYAVNCWIRNGPILY
jgi:prolyl 4-hydroxylase